MVSLNPLKPIVHFWFCVIVALTVGYIVTFSVVAINSNEVVIIIHETTG